MGLHVVVRVVGRSVMIRHVFERAILSWETKLCLDGEKRGRERVECDVGASRKRLIETKGSLIKGYRQS